MLSIKKWLGLNTEIYVGCVTKSIIIFAYENNYKLWKQCLEMPNNTISSSVFYEKPVLYVINTENTENSKKNNKFMFNTGLKMIKCLFVNNINVYHNNCIIKQVIPNIEERSDSYKETLNYPVEIILEIPINQTIRIKGFWQDNVFCITALSNYPIY